MLLLKIKIFVEYALRYSSLVCCGFFEDTKACSLGAFHIPSPSVLLFHLAFELHNSRI